MSEFDQMAGYGQAGAGQLTLDPSSGMLVNQNILAGEGMGNIAGSMLNQNFSSPGSGSGGTFSMDNLFGKDGWGKPVLGAAAALGSTWLGMKQYGLAKEQLEEGKRQFEKNFGAQRTLTNSRLEDRQRARVASNSDGYVSVDKYMNKNRVR